MSSIALGVAVAVISGATQSLGLTLQRKAHLIGSNQQRQGQSEPPAADPNEPFTVPQLGESNDSLENCTSSSKESLRLWRVGVLLFIAANIVGSSVQIVTLPLVILCPLQAVGLVFNSVWSSVILGEPFTRRLIQGTIFVAIGAVFLSGIGIGQEPERSLKELQSLFGRAPFLRWMFMSLSVVFILVNWTDQDLKYRTGIQLGVASGILSAHSLLMAKVAVGLVVLVLEGDIWLLMKWQVWAIVLAFASFAVAQLYFVNCGLRYVSTSMLYPLVFCVYNVTSMFNGFIFYGVHALFSAAQVSSVFVGTFILLTGVLFLSSRLQVGVSVDCEESLIAPTRRGTYDRSSSELEPLIGSHYTSLESLNPNISNPDAVRSASVPSVFPTSTSRPKRVLSKEQAEILDELKGSTLHPAAIVHNKHMTAPQGGPASSVSSQQPI